MASCRKLLGASSCALPKAARRTPSSALRSCRAKDPFGISPAAISRAFLVPEFTETLESRVANEIVAYSNKTAIVKKKASRMDL